MTRRVRGVRPSLTTLLALRHTRAEASRAAYGAAVAARHGAERAAAALRDDLTRHEVTGAGWHGTVAQRERLRDALAIADGRVAESHAAEADARIRWAADRRAERVLEKLVDRVAAARRDALARAEQAALDETGLDLHRRARGNAAAAPSPGRAS